MEFDQGRGVTVHFIGAGPGAPDLLTVRAVRLLESSPVCVYAGTYTNPLGDTERSRIFEWTQSGTLLRSWTVPGQDLSKPHGVQVAISDAAGRLVLLEKSTRRIMRLDLRTGRFSTYSRVESPWVS